MLRFSIRPSPTWGHVSTSKECNPIISPLPPDLNLIDASCNVMSIVGMTEIVVEGRDGKLVLVRTIVLHTPIVIIIAQPIKPRHSLS